MHNLYTLNVKSDKIQKVHYNVVYKKINMLHAYYSDLIQSVMIYQNSHNQVYIEAENEKGVTQLTGKMVAIDNESIHNENIDTIISKFENFSIYKISTGFPEEEIKIYGNTNLKTEILHIFESDADVVTIGMVDPSNECDFVIISIFSTDSQVLSMFDYNFEFPELFQPNSNVDLGEKELKPDLLAQNDQIIRTELKKEKKEDSNSRKTKKPKKSTKTLKLQSNQVKSESNLDKKSETNIVQKPEVKLLNADTTPRSVVEQTIPISSSMVILKQFSSKMQSKAIEIETWKEKVHHQKLKNEKLIKNLQSEKLNNKKLKRTLNEKEKELLTVSAQLKELQDEILHLHDLMQLE
ncbi:hypothetical protein NEF87_004516 [Candidatus Lokiarchaeum ossiferum]|uniref:Uncharacterized protein n=1 Tax=Candidatus Lokiarchaeum ossiferum TaxID=2951803 RepID=A0ABY6HY06_9ARCH|nr:hypothetical protein NEF87_004516 [Candidatus Lokiarchaeum sp. B-35]